MSLVLGPLGDHPHTFELNIFTYLLPVFFAPLPGEIQSIAQDRKEKEWRKLVAECGTVGC